MAKQDKPKNTSKGKKEVIKTSTPTLLDTTSEKTKVVKNEVLINKFTIQINKSNLIDYFGSALIYPVNYETRELARSQRTKDIKQILGTTTEDVLNAFKLLVGDRTLEALQAIDQLKPSAPELILLAFLFRFRDKEGSDKYALKEQLSYLIDRKVHKAPKTFNRASIVLAVLGLYYGYRSLPKDEKINLNDSYFASFSESGRFNIKYKLDNLLDRITIESVYQFCFCDNQKNSFDFLNDDKAFVKYDLNEGYSDEKTFSIIENYPIIRISKHHSEPNKRVKNKTLGVWAKFISFIDVLKRNGLAQGDVTFDTAEFDIWLHNHPSSDLEKILAEFQTLQQNEPTNN